MLNSIKERLLNLKTVSGIHKLIAGGVIIAATMFGVVGLAAQIVPFVGIGLVAWGAIDLVRK